jgi:carbamoyltransferase
MDLARSVQVVCEEIMLRMARTAHRETGLDSLVLAGGVALNCVGNGRLLREGPFKQLWIQPAAGDAGGALGVAQLIAHRHFKRPRVLKRRVVDVAAVPVGAGASARVGGNGGAGGTPPSRSSNTAASRSSEDVTPYADAMNGAYLGPEFSSEEIETYLKSVGAKYQKLERAELTERAADILADEKIIGWFNGRMEFGPRSLGNRSIIGDSRSPRMQAQMNLKIKFRESFRPFAPSVLRERVHDYFEMDCD